MSEYFPLFQKIDAQRRILVIGGGSVATAKIEALRPHAPYLTVKSLAFREDLENMLRKENIAFAKGAYHPDDLENIAIVIAATNDRSLNETIKKQANQKGILVNCVDDRALCDFIFPALVRRGSLQIAISTAGISPVLARLVKRSVETLFPANFSDVIDFLQSKRKIVIETLSSLQPRRLFWEKFISSGAIDQILKGNKRKAEQIFNKFLRSQDRGDNAALYLIGAGCGDPDLITVKAVQLLSRADVVLYDRLVAPELLERYARKDAEKIEVGKKRGKHHMKQNDIDHLIARYLRQGKIIARLKGGDPGIFGHASEEIEIAKINNAAWEIVPGITAAVGCAAHSGIPLTERGRSKSLRIMTLYEDDVYDDGFWRSLASARGETFVFYMSIKHKTLICQKLIEAGLSADTPIMAVEQGTTSEHREYAATLESFPVLYGETSFMSPTLFIVGDVVRYRSEHGWREEKTGLKASFFDYPSLETPDGGKIYAYS
ncbi:MAG: siroheme synthase CysG [Pseudomonadota bacterium]